MNNTGGWQYLDQPQPQTKDNGGWEYYEQTPAAAAPPAAPKNPAATPGTFQTEKGGKLYNSNSLMAEPISYPTESAAVSGSMARASMPSFPEEVRKSTNRAAEYAPAAGGLVGGLFGPAGAGLGTAAGRLAEPSVRAGVLSPPGWEDAKSAAAEGAATYAGGKVIEAAAPVVGRMVGSGRQLARDIADKYVGKTLGEAILPTPEPVIPQGPERMGAEEFGKVHGAKIAENETSPFSTQTPRQEATALGRFRNTPEEPVVPQGPERMGPEEFERVHGAKISQAEKEAQARAVAQEHLRQQHAEALNARGSLMAEGEVPGGELEPTGSGRRPSPSERQITNIVRSRVVTPQEAARELKELGPNSKLQPEEGLMQRENRLLGNVRARRAARGMVEPRP